MIFAPSAAAFSAASTAEASAGVVEKLIADADAEGLDASAYVAALAGN